MPLPDPRSNAFWILERKLLGQSFSELAMSILLAGATSGAQLLPSKLDVLINWDIFNTQALQWLGMYLGPGGPALTPGVSEHAFAWANSLTDTTRKRVVTEIDNWVRSGDPLDVLKNRLAPVFGNARAKQVAVTEVTRIYASGNLMAWNASGVVGAKRWRTARDERVCPICGPMHMTIVEIDRDWQFTPDMRQANPTLAKVLDNLKTDAFTAPPAHVNCRCWLSPVVLEAHDPDELGDQHFFMKQQRIVEEIANPPQPAPILLEASVA